MSLETLFLIVMASGLVLPVVAVIAGLGFEVFSDPTRGNTTTRMSRTALNRLMDKHQKKSLIKRFLRL